MVILNDDTKKPNISIINSRWKRVREAQKSGELNRQNSIGPSDQRRKSQQNTETTTSTNRLNESAHKHPQYRFHQLVERVRELQREVVPDLLYQMPSTTYSGFPPVITPSSTVGQPPIPTFPYHHQNISVSSGSSVTSMPNQRYGLSPKLLERAHQIPERFDIEKTIDVN